jgi:hypothetical protein
VQNIDNLAGLVYNTKQSIPFDIPFSNQQNVEVICAISKGKGPQSFTAAGDATGWP